MAGQKGRSAGTHIRVSLEIETRRVGMPPQKLCVSTCYVYKCGGVLLVPMLKPRVCPATRMHMR
jgi:hypothetical protein